MNVAYKSQAPSIYTEYTNAFYDVVLGQNEESEQLNAVEVQVISRVNNMITSKQSIIHEIPCLPNILTELLAVFDNENIGFREVANTIKKDPVLAGNVLRIANSPLYRSRGGEITSIESAVSLLGMRDVAEIASTVLIQTLIKSKAVYFKNFGQFIWFHALQMAYVCRYFSTQVNGNSYVYYLAGLIFNIGKMIIYHTLNKEFSEVLGKEQPRSLPYRLMMISNAQQLSVLAAEDWKLPEEIVCAYKEQIGFPKSELALSLNLSMEISRSYLLIENGILKRDESFDRLVERGFQRQFITSFYQYASDLR